MYNVGDKIVVYTPQYCLTDHYEFWEFDFQTMEVLRLTRRKHNLVVGGWFSSQVYDKNTGKCVSRRGRKSVPAVYQRGYLEKP